MHEMSLENLDAVTGGIVVSRAKEIYKYLSDEDKKKVEEMEKEMLEKINGLGIGPGGLGGTVTALAVNIETYPTHIAGLPVAINICCHANRHVNRVI